MASRRKYSAVVRHHLVAFGQADRRIEMRPDPDPFEYALMDFRRLDPDPVPRVVGQDHVAEIGKLSRPIAIVAAQPAA